MSRERGSITRDETAAPRTSLPAGSASGGSAGSGEDSLIRRLRDLRVHAPSSASQAQASRAARAAFVRAWDVAPWYARVFASAGRAGMPVVLASVVGLYLFWAFATAIALNR